LGQLFLRMRFLTIGATVSYDIGKVVVRDHDFDGNTIPIFRSIRLFDSFAEETDFK
jgi:hypothetical protein